MRLLIFARRPVPGRCKTRLIPALGAAGAAELHARLLRHALASARAARLGRLELWVDQLAGDPGSDSGNDSGSDPGGDSGDDTIDPLWQALAAEFGANLRLQCRGDLGARMHGALRDALRRSPDGALLLGSDCPPLTPGYLRAAAAALRTQDAAFAPVADGGYALIGLRRARGALFRQMPWSSAAVMAETRRRLHRLGLTHWRGETLWDVDRPQDLARLGAYPGLAPTAGLAAAAGQVAAQGQINSPAQPPASRT